MNRKPIDNLLMKMKKNKRNFLLIPFILLGMTILSCNRTGKDYSLEKEKYVSLGMPDHTKKWNSDDYGEANITLGTLRNEAPLSFPRKYSKKSGEVFSRLVSEENISFVYDTTIPLKIRAYMIQHYPGITGEFEYLYSYEKEGKSVYGEELIEIIKFNLSIHNKMLELSGIIDKSDDESLSGFKDGKMIVRNYYVNFISSMHDKISKPGIKSARGIDELIRAILESVNTNALWMTTQDKAKMGLTLSKLGGMTQSKALKKDLIKTAGSLSD